VGWRLLLEILSAFRQTETAAGSFDSARLTPRYAQDDRQLKVVRAISREAEIHFQTRREGADCHQLRRVRGRQISELPARTGNAIWFSSDRNSNGSFDSARLTPRYAQDDRQLRLAGATCHAPSAATFEDWQRGVTTLDPPFITLRSCRSFPSIAGCSSRFRAKWSVVASRR
jgi:hypothetical protein